MPYQKYGYWYVGKRKFPTEEEAWEYYRESEESKNGK